MNYDRLELEGNISGTFNLPVIETRRNTFPGHYRELL